MSQAWAFDELARQLLRLRYWQHVMNEALKHKRFTIPIHVAFGHEAIATAVNAAMQLEDQLVLTHRNMAYNLARAGDLSPLYEEYTLSPAGVGQGRLGSMNVANPAHGVEYASSILGNNLSVACGLALAKQVKEEPGLVIALTGDGAMEEGAFYEGIVFAQSQRLRVLILVENNNYSMSSTIPQRRCPIAIDAICRAVGMPYWPLAGNDVMGYARVLEEARSAIAQGQGPGCLEVQLSTLCQHAGPTPGWPTDPKCISLERGFIVEDTPNDPAFVLKQSLGADRFDALCDEVLDEQQAWAPAGRA